MVTEDLQTYMLEINRSPALYYYTEVSVDVVGTVMNDLIKGKLTFCNDLVNLFVLFLNSEYVFTDSHFC